MNCCRAGKGSSSLVWRALACRRFSLQFIMLPPACCLPPCLLLIVEHCMQTCTMQIRCWRRWRRGRRPKQCETQ